MKSRCRDERLLGSIRERHLRVPCCWHTRRARRGPPSPGGRTSGASRARGREGRPAAAASAAMAQTLSEWASGRVCDWCQEVCDLDASDLNVLTCSFRGCPSQDSDDNNSVYHKECVEAYLKSSMERGGARSTSLGLGDDASSSRANPQILGRVERPSTREGCRAREPDRTRLRVFPITPAHRFAFPSGNARSGFGVLAGGRGSRRTRRAPAPSTSRMASRLERGRRKRRSRRDREEPVKKFGPEAKAARAEAAPRARGRAGAGAEASRGGDAEGEGSRGSREASRAQTGGEQVGDGERRAEASKGVGRARKETHRREKRRRARLRSVRAGSGSGSGSGSHRGKRWAVRGYRRRLLSRRRALRRPRAKTTIRNTTGPPAGSPAALRSGTTWTRRGRRSLSERMRPRGGVRTCPNRGPRLRTEPERRTRTRRPREPRSRRRSTPRRSARLRRRRGEVAVGPPRGVSRRRSRGTARRAAPAPPSRPAFPSSAPTTPCARCRCGCSGAGWAARRTCAFFWTT